MTADPASVDCRPVWTPPLRMFIIGTGSNPADVPPDGDGAELRRAAAADRCQAHGKDSVKRPSAFVGLSIEFDKGGVAELGQSRPVSAGRSVR
jgi:hypothetical protein